jgi:hypothetical protein
MITETCLACQATQPYHQDPETNKIVWVDLITERGGTIRSFCCMSCCDAFELWTDDEKQMRLFGRPGFAEELVRDMSEGRIAQDTPAIGDVLWKLDFGTTLHTNTVPDERTGLPQGKCPNPTKKSAAHLTNPDCCLDCMFKQPMGWRQVVAR